MFKIGEREFGDCIVDIQRGVNRETAYDVTTEDGVRHAPVRALYPVYSLTLGNIHQEEYDALYELANTYAESLTVTLPDGQSDITFPATVEIGGDGLVFVEQNGTRRWDGLTLTITGTTPQARDGPELPACEISFGLYDVTAHTDSTPICQDVQPFVDLAQLKEDELAVENYATCEWNHFVLDGSMKLFPDDPEKQNFGLWSGSLSGDDRLFVVPPVLDVTFSENHSSIGLTFRFQEYTQDYCDHLNVKWYNSAGELLADQDFHPDSAYYLADRQVENYRRVVVTFYSTNRPRRYLKLTEIIYGAIRVFGQGDLISAGILEETDPVSTTLPISTMNFKFHSAPGEFAILDMKGVFGLLQKRQEVDVYETVDGEKKWMGTYYLDAPEADTENTTTMSCTDILGVLDQTDFKGGIYTDVTAGALAAEILTSARVPDALDTDPTLAAMKLSGWIPICTHREALQQVAFAVGATVNTARTDKIQLYPAPEMASGTIGRDRKILSHRLKMESLVTGVEITAHSYVAVTDAQKDQELQNGALPVGEQEITFGAPMHTLSVTGATILESGANYAKLNVVAEGTVVLKGRPYNDNTSTFGAYMPELPANEKANILRIEDATLVGPGNAQAVAQRVYDYYQLRYQDTGDLILSGEQVGQRVIMDSMNGRQIEGLIESLDIDLTGGFLATAKVTGKAVEN